MLAPSLELTKDEHPRSLHARVGKPNREHRGAVHLKTINVSSKARLQQSPLHLLELAEIDVGEPQCRHDFLGEFVLGVALQKQAHVDNEVGGVTEGDASDSAGHR